MKLKWFHVREFQSVRNSGPINVNDITCLVGKNEAGKSALLKALYRLNPIVEAEGVFSITNDYPRMEVEDYRHDVESGRRSHAIPIKAGYALDNDEISSIHELFGPECIDGEPELTLSKTYENKLSFWLNADSKKAVSYLIEKADFSEQTREAISGAPPTAEALIARLQQQEQTEEVRRILAVLSKIQKRDVNGYIYDTILKPRTPKYLYFDEYYQMTGHENIEALQQRQASGHLKRSDHPLLGLIRLARLELSELLNPSSTIDLKNRLEGASNHLTKQVFKFWSQNRHLRMTFDVRPARPGDPEGMQSGTNIWGGVLDTRHQVTTELGSRSRGFVWFFSFLAWYSDVKRSDAGPVILLLDEPGLTLHAKAQHDLLRYFEIELKESHQLIYSTHSPFMIDPEHFERVRIVQDKSIESDQDVDFEHSGTTVLTDVFAATSDSLFPLQGALGYELHQTLFVGPYSLVVEGAADLLFIQAMTALLQEEGRTGLDPRWTVTPVGGAAKVPTFVALLGTQRGMTIATLIDNQVADRERIEGLYREKLLKRANVFTFAEFTKTPEADIEDMFGADFYVDLVNAEFAAQLNPPIELAKLSSKSPRILRRLEEHFEKAPLREASFSHYRPARYFNENLKKLAKKIPPDAKARFEQAFEVLNGLIKERSKK
jgi:predicted ATP-dependent endonuclease of OLD family